MAYRRLGLNPATFWQLTITEWQTLLSSTQKDSAAMDQITLQNLMQKHPDR